MNVHVITSGPVATNAYLVASPQTHEAVLIDPACDCSEEIIALIEKKNYKLTKILLTHSHWDHFGDAALLKKKYKVPLLVHSLDRENCVYPGSDGLPMIFPIDPVTPDATFEEGQIVDQFKVIHTPGHSPGSVCFYCEAENVLFSGDTLFKGSIGNLSFPSSQPDKMWVSLAKLERLPPKTLFYPGHGPPSTIGSETWLPNAKKLFNPNGMLL